MARTNKNKRERASEETPDQVYDSTLKNWVKDNPATIIPVICQGAVFQSALDIEIIKPTMRADRVYKVVYKGKPCLLNIEFESGSDTKMRERLLIYNMVLYKEHQVPVISSIIYPFNTTMAQSPLRIELDEGEEMLVFHFFTLPLFQLQADSFLREHLTCMYPLLPAMQGTNVHVMEQALAELKELYRDDEGKLSEQVIWMQLLLNRTTLLTNEEKKPIQEVLKMYDPLWDEHPKVIQIKATAKEVAESEAREKYRAKTKEMMFKLESEAKAKRDRMEAREASREKRMEKEAATREKEAMARLEEEAVAREKEAMARLEEEAVAKLTCALRESIFEMLSMRFPGQADLQDLVQQATEHITNPEGMNRLLLRVTVAADEDVLRQLLQLLAL